MQPCGDFTIVVYEAVDLPTKAEYYARVELVTADQKVSKKTPTTKRTNNPKWVDDNRLNFPVFASDGEVHITLWDKDIITKDDIIAECVFPVGGSRTTADEWVELECPSHKRHKAKDREKIYGRINVSWDFVYSEFNAALAYSGVDEEEEEDVTMTKLIEMTTRLGWYGYHAASIGFWITDNLMWNYPFTNLTTLLLIVAVSSITAYGAEALIPFLVFLLMARALFMRNRYGIDWSSKVVYDPAMPLGVPPPLVPAGRLRMTMPELHSILSNPTKSVLMGKGMKVAYVWVATAVRTLDWISEVYTWQRQQWSRLLLRVSIASTVFVLLFGIPFRLIILSATFLAYVAFPLYYSVPALRPRLSPEHLLKVARVWWRRVMSRVNVPSVARVIPEIKRAPEHLPPIPPEKRKYQEWERFYKEREALRSRYNIDTPLAAGVSGFTPINLVVEISHIRDCPGALASRKPFVRFNIGSFKFRTRESEGNSLSWNIQYSAQGVTASLLTNPIQVAVIASNPSDALLAAGEVRTGYLQPGINKEYWIPLKTPEGLPAGDLKANLLFSHATAAPVPPQAAAL